MTPCVSVLCAKLVHFDKFTVFPWVWWGRCVWYAVPRDVGFKLDSGSAEEGLEEILDFMQRARHVGSCVSDAKPLLEPGFLWHDGGGGRGGGGHCLGVAWLVEGRFSGRRMRRVYLVLKRGQAGTCLYN
jgi:hypothetical protein